MPDPVTHYVFSRQVVSLLPEQIQKYVDLPIFDRALHGADPWSTIHFYGGRYKRHFVRSSIMHKTKTGLFLSLLSEQVKEEPSPQRFSVLVGMICHYCLDKHTHPYINFKSGRYDGTEETKWQRSGHVRLERAIDSYYIRHVFGKTPWHFSIPGNLLCLKRYPEELRKPLNFVYQQVYGWENVFDEINVSLRDECLFYGLMQDPFGIVSLLLKVISYSSTNYQAYSYYHKDVDSDKLDYLNLRHEPWHHPNDSSLVSCDSFFDLFDKARTEAVDMICRIHEWIFCGDLPLNADLFGNLSYSTGFDCDDPRNHAELSCQPLNLGLGK